MENLSYFDMMILRFILKNTSSSAETIEKKLQRVESVPARLKALETLHLVHQDFSELKDGSLVRCVPLGTYQITEEGKRTLQDYLFSSKKSRRELWLKNAWIPIIVSFATTVSTSYIIPRLPTLIEWFRHILARIVS